MPNLQASVPKSKRAVKLLTFSILVAMTGAFTFSVVRANRQWKLSEAAWTGDLDAVKRCVDAGVSIDAEPKSEAGGGAPALVAAAWDGHDDVILFLLDHGANINRRDSCGNTALNAASNHGHLSTVQLLLSRGADPNIRGEAGNPLENAIERKNARMTDLLKAHGATE